MENETTIPFAKALGYFDLKMAREALSQFLYLLTKNEIKVLLTMMNGELTHGDLSLEVADAESNIAFWLEHSAQ